MLTIAALPREPEPETLGRRMDCGQGRTLILQEKPDQAVIHLVSRKPGVFSVTGMLYIVDAEGIAVAGRVIRRKASPAALATWLLTHRKATGLDLPTLGLFCAVLRSGPQEGPNDAA